MDPRPNTGEDGRAWADSPHVTDELRPFLEWLLARHSRLGGITEIRILGRGNHQGVWSAFVGPGGEDSLVRDLAPLGPTPRPRTPAGDHPRVGEANVYFSLQAVRPGPERAWRGFRRVRSTTRDADIHAYTVMAIDVDPERRPRDLPASDEEKAEARAVAERVRAWLAERGAETLMADSGNGWHVLVPLTASLEEDVGPAAKDARTLLRHLDAQFSTPGAHVDTATFNPSRILKLYGTLSVKGEPAPGRPHRWSGIDLASIPEDVDLFERLRAEFEEGQGAFRGTVVPPSSTAAPRPESAPDHEASWKDWRVRALAVLPLERIYGDLLTGRTSGASWLQCRDPSSESGDQHPSAGVADGSGEAERGSFHSFRTGETISVFDHLVRSGQVADFAAACARVAEASGVLLPSGVQHSHPDAVERFRVAWEAAGDNTGSRERALRDGVADALALPALAQQQAMEGVREVSGAAPAVVRQIAQEIRKDARRKKKRALVAAPSGGRLPVVDYVHNRDTVDALFAALLDAALPAKRLFRCDRELVFVRPGTGPALVHERNLGGLLSSLVEIRFLAETDEGPVFERFDVIPGDLSRAFVSSPRVLDALPPLEMYTRSPTFDRAWNYVGEPGYHEASAVYYDGEAIAPCAGVANVVQAIQDFRWKGEADLVNFVGALLTGLTMPHWGRGHPFLAVNGNKPGVGKSTLARVLGVIAEGAEPSTVSFVTDEAEFEKQLATRIEAGDRVVVIDNARTRAAIQSPVLERCITDTKLNFRRLGTNSAISRPTNDVLFCLTMNLTQIGPDLRRRALPLNLEIDTSVREANYPKDDLVAWVLEHRAAIVSELASMVQAWLDLGRPECDAPARHSTGQRWASTMDAILRLAGFDGFLTNFEASEHAFDERYQLVQDIASEHAERPAATAAGWVERLTEILEDRFKDKRGNAKSARARATIVGSLLRDYVDASFTVGDKTFILERAFPEGPTHPPTYGFREVGA